MYILLLIYAPSQHAYTGMIINNNITQYYYIIKKYKSHLRWLSK